MATKTPIENGQNTAPVARGKAEAMASFLARKGSPRDGARYNRLVQKFEVMWQKAPDALKEKYASRARTDLAPSERPGATVNRPVTNATLNKPKPAARGSVTPPPIAAPGPRTENPRDRKDRDTVPAGGERDREIRNHSVNRDPAVEAANTASEAANRKVSDAGGEVNVGTPEQQAEVAKMLNEGSGMATAGRGNDAVNIAAAAAAKESAAKTEAERAAVRAAEINVAKTQPRTATGTAPALGTPAPAQSPKEAAGATVPATPPPGGKAYSDEYSDGFLNAAAKGEKYPTREEAGKPFKDPGLAPGDNYEAEEATRQANNSKIEADNAEKGLSPLGGAVTPPSSAPATPATPVAGKPPIAGPKEAADAKIGEAPAGMVLIGTGWKRDAAGNKTNEREAKYGTMDDSYGKAKPSISNTIANTPETADSTKPVMIQGQSNEERVADYQTRSNTPQSRDAAGATLESMGVNANASGRTAPPIAGPRGPASQIQPKGPDHNAIQLAAGRSREAAEREGVRRQAEQAKQPTMNDVNRRFTPGTEEHRAAAYGVNPTTGAQLTKDDTMKPGTSRITNTRPATPDEIRTGNAGAPPPTIQRPQIARRR